MEIQYKVKRFIILNLILLIILYCVPIKHQDLESMCFIKRVTGNECVNCGMTRAFLSILHFQFRSAYQYNTRVVIVFPLIVGYYLFCWYKYIKKG